MRVDLHNFFQYYDPKNPKHVAAVEELEKELGSKLAYVLEDRRIIIETQIEPVIHLPVRCVLSF
jgi:hypothetical protein